MNVNRRCLRNYLRLFSACFMFWIYLPHLLLFAVRGGVKTDVKRIKKQIGFNMSDWMAFIYLIHNNRYFRTIFYYRIGPIWALFIGWWRPGDRYFQISYTTKIGEGILVAHPYSTVINAESIGDNFSCIHCTTLGDKDGGRPILGNNVTLGANVTIIGNVHIGNNVVVGAGSVVVKDIPDNCVVAGNPAKVLKVTN